MPMDRLPPDWGIGRIQFGSSCMLENTACGSPAHCRWTRHHRIGHGTDYLARKSEVMTRWRWAEDVAQSEVMTRWRWVEDVTPKELQQTVVTLRQRKEELEKFESCEDKNLDQLDQDNQNLREILDKQIQEIQAKEDNVLFREGIYLMRSMHQRRKVSDLIGMLQQQES